MVAGLDQRAVGVEGRATCPTCGRCARPARPRSALHELVVDARLRQHVVHQVVEARREQRAVREQVVQPRHLEGGGAVREVARPDRAGKRRLVAVRLADPQAAVAAARRRSGSGPTAGCRAGGSPPTHLSTRVASSLLEWRIMRFIACEPRGIQREAAALGLDERAEQDGDLRQARRVHHRVAVEHGEAGRGPRGHVDQGHRQMAAATAGSRPRSCTTRSRPRWSPGSCAVRRSGSVAGCAHATPAKHEGGEDDVTHGEGTASGARGGPRRSSKAVGDGWMTNGEA